MLRLHHKCMSWCPPVHRNTLWHTLAPPLLCFFFRTHSVSEYGLSLSQCLFYLLQKPICASEIELVLMQTDRIQPQWISVSYTGDVSDAWLNKDWNLKEQDCFGLSYDAYLPSTLMAQQEESLLFSVLEKHFWTACWHGYHYPPFEILFIIFISIDTLLT